MTKSMAVALCDDGNPPNVWVARITYEFTEGCHIFTSDQIPGLFIATPDPKKAFQQLRPTIETLINKNHSVNCAVLLGKEFREFEKNHSSLSLKDTYAVISKADNSKAA